MSKPQVVVVGAGLAGLNCARVLSPHVERLLILEGNDYVGGRVSTEVVDGFLLDRGFQVLQTAYPEAQQALDYEQLDLVELEPGALVRQGRKWHCMSDPFRRPSQAVGTFWNGIGTMLDRWRLLTMQRSICIEDSLPSVATTENSSLALTTEEYLHGIGFSQEFVDHFLRPWIAGMFFETEMATSAEFFKFVFRMLCSAPIAMPAQGMQSIPLQLLEQVQEPELRLNCQVKHVRNGQVFLTGGECIEADAIVVATEPKAAGQILGVEEEIYQTNATTCLYFTAPDAPVDSKHLLLNGEATGPVNHVFIPTNSVPGYSQSGRTLISVNLVGAAALQAGSEAVLEQMRAWFGSHVESWDWLKTFELPSAVLFQPPSFFERRLSIPEDAGVFRCGDYCASGSIQGALESGRLAAESVRKYLESRV